jgi:hypothetical protein
MNITFDRAERLQQREILKKVFPSYLPLHHDAFVAEYNRKIERENLAEYMENKGIK